MENKAIQQASFQPSDKFAIADAQEKNQIQASKFWTWGEIRRGDCTIDAGATFTKASGDQRIWQRGWYFSKVAIDPKNVIINIPVNEREHPDSFISRVQRLPVPILPGEPRVGRVAGPAGAAASV